MMSSSEEDPDEFGVEKLPEEASQPSQTLPTHTNYSRPSKRRKKSISEDDSNQDFIDDEDYESSTRHKKRRNTSVEEDSLDEFDGTQVRKRRSKYKIHVPRDHVLPAITVQYSTQQQDDLDSSPYRIRGAKWKLPKVPAPKSLTSRNPKSRQARTESTLDKNSLSGKRSPLQSLGLKSAEPNGAIDPPCLLGDTTVKVLVSPGGPSAADISRELDDLPSDAFLSSPDVGPSTHPVDPPSLPQQKLVGPQTGLRQTTLFGGCAPHVESTPSQLKRVHNYRVDMVSEAPTHHKLDHEALKTWIYPTNLGPIRDYQFNIVRQGLFSNMLVALPTGLGKTFIAATIMLNYFRWTIDSKIVFMAPTKPLVSQQVDACFSIVGIPRSATTMLTGEVPPSIREEDWGAKRVFFMTPQTLDNDLRSGIADPKKIVLLVVDEAHRATGNYSYVKVVSFMRRFSKSFRVLALTATPGASVEAVQEVIDGLEISKVEIRTEESMDIQQFTHRRKIEQILLDPSDEMIMVKDLFSKALKPLVDQLCAQNAYWNKDPMSLTTFGLMQAQKSWLMSDTGRRASYALKGMIRGLCSILASVAHGIKLLNFHGIGPFYGTMRDFRASVEERGDKAGKYRRQINDSPYFKTMMDRIAAWIHKDDFVGHPKLTYLCDTILNHFLDAGEGRLPDGAPHSGTRVIVFSEYRDSAEEICRVLNRHKPMIRASVFVGQADSKRSEGMNQTKQIDTISRFKSGTYNVLVATSIGEEGLDIGQVDLIVCYDASGSPIRMLQRMGRTGRKRAGNIVLLLMRGKEEEAFAKSKDNYEQMQKLIASGTRFNFRFDLATRIIPKDILPTVDKRHVEIPLENTQDHSLPEPKRRPSRTKKKSAKKFHMPDGVKTGFRKASLLAKNCEESDDSNSEVLETSEDQLTPIPEIKTVLLSTADLKDLERSYQNVHGDDMQEVSMPEMTSKPEFQRSLGPWRIVRHGKATQRFVSMIGAIRNVTKRTVEEWGHIHDDQGPIYLQQGPAGRSPSSSHVSVTSSLNLLEEQPGSRDPRSRKRLAKAPKSQRRNVSLPLSQDQSTTASSDENDEDELEGFIVQDTDPIYNKHTASTLSSSPPPDFPPSKAKLFFEPTHFTSTQDTNDDDDAMPDLSALLGQKDTQSLPSSFISNRAHEHFESGRDRRGWRRRILEAEDSDE